MVRQPQADLLGIDQQLCFALYSASLAMTKVYLPLLEPLGITFPQYLVMLVLWEGDDLAVYEIGERLSLDSGTLTPLLKRLELAGFITRLRDTVDERRVHVRLTSQGKALRKRAGSVQSDVICATSCDADTRASLTEQLTTLRDSLTAFVADV
jgi:MarR family transcriptional regulator, organic hydroperoxide resistance regulator